MHPGPPRVRCLALAFGCGCAVPARDSTEAEPPPAIPPSVESLPVVPCTNPAEALGYDPLLDDPGLHAQDSLDGWGAGVTVGDADGDGRRDVLISHKAKFLLLMGQEGGRSFSEESDARLGIGSDLLPRHTQLVDLDADGHDDLVFTDMWGLQYFFRADGAGRFVATEVVGWPSRVSPPDSFTKGRSLAWGDIDGDGDLDAFVGNDGTSDADPRNLLVRRTGALTAEDATENVPSTGIDPFTKVASLLDVDGDDDLDLYVANHLAFDHGGNGLFLNDGTGVFTADPEAGLDLVMAAMGVAYADLNDDGDPDILLSDWYDPHLMLSNGGTWYDAAAALGLVRTPFDTQVAGWGNALEDLDNDGDVDAIMVFGPGAPDEVAGSNPDAQPDAVWIQQDGTFTPMAAELGLDDPDEGRALAVVDLDGDGMLDLVNGPLDQPARITYGRCNANAWVTVSVAGPPENPYGVGAWVEVEAGGHTQRRWLLLGGTSNATQVPVEAHFGLGDADRIDALTVHLPGHDEVRLTDVSVRTRLRVRVP